MTERLRTRIEEVTSRQLEVARLVAEGHTNPEIATSLGITLDGAKYHVSELLGRLGLERREEIADWYRSERGAQRRRRLFSGLFASAPRAFASAVGATALVAVGALFAIGLSGGRAEEVTAAVASPTPTSTPSATPAAENGVPPVGTTGDASDLPLDLQGLPFLLGQRLHSEAPEVLSWERVDWFDGCFDIDVPGGCPLSVSPVPGYRVVMELAGDRYVARTGVEVGRYALEEAPPVDLPTSDPPVSYRWTGDADLRCLEVTMVAGGAGSIAGCGEPATPFQASETLVGQIDFFAHVTRSLDYEATTPEGHQVEVHGLTAAEPGAEEARAIDEWGRLLAIETYAGRAGASFALAIGWRDDTASTCRSVELQTFGLAFREPCPGVRILGEAELAQLYGWLDRYAPFELRGPDDRQAMVFGGHGAEIADPGTQQEIWDWMAALAADEASTAAE